MIIDAESHRIAIQVMNGLLFPCAIEICEISSQDKSEKHFHQYVVSRGTSTNIEFFSIQEWGIADKIRVWSAFVPLCNCICFLLDNVKTRKR